MTDYDEQVELDVNGERVAATVPARMLLVHYLREVAGCTGVHVGCDTGNCGACTVLLDGQPVKSCMLLAAQGSGQQVTTVEGLDAPCVPALRQAFTAHGAIQCGYCTPGMLTNATALLCEQPDADEESIRNALRGNLCMCTGYQQIVDAISAVAQQGEAAQR
ncbi:MAG: 2Fe-2S iron-sulfur cluster binding domain-containing protein [Streptosporangiales bacterium]|nr:2Fe-2S iron-sulfur cluster binding domain-containing protein [Streptosporangiales bacterium]